MLLPLHSDWDMVIRAIGRVSRIFFSRKTIQMVLFSTRLLRVSQVIHFVFYYLETRGTKTACADYSVLNQTFQYF